MLVIFKSMERVKKQPKGPIWNSCGRVTSYGGLEWGITFCFGPRRQHQIPCGLEEERISWLKRFKRIKRWSYMGTLWSLKRPSGEKAAQESSFLENLYLLYSTWPTPGWPLVGENTDLAPLYFPCLQWTRRRLRVGVIGGFKPARCVSDESPQLPLASTPAAPSSVKCFAFILFFHASSFFFLSQKLFLGPELLPFKCYNCICGLLLCDNVIRQRKRVWQPPSAQ